MVGWHHRLNGHVFEITSGDTEGQKSLACCGPWGHKESDMTDRTATATNHEAKWDEVSPQAKTPYQCFFHDKPAWCCSHG